jgi:hypothetical protein
MATIDELRGMMGKPMLTMEMLRRGLTDAEIDALEKAEMLWVNIINDEVTIGRH